MSNAAELPADDPAAKELTAEELAEARRYSMIIAWSDEDDAYIITVPELPGCRTHGATRAEAIAMGEEVIAGWIAAARARGRPIPPPRLFAGFRLGWAEREATTANDEVRATSDE